VSLRGAARLEIIAIMRLRAAQNKLKIEHSIIDGVRAMLERLLAANPEIRSVIPGVIRLAGRTRQNSSARHGPDTQNGWKANCTEPGRAAGTVHQHRDGEKELEQELRKAAD
jgi:hypothetical protein